MLALIIAYLLKNNIILKFIDGGGFIFLFNYLSLNSVIRCCLARKLISNPRLLFVGFSYFDVPAASFLYIALTF